MKQCESCSTKGLFLKLHKGLCSSCYKELQSLEHTYDEIVDNIATENINIKEITGTLNKLIVRIRKFGNISTIKEDDCLRLLNNLSLDYINMKTIEDHSNTALNATEISGYNYTEKIYTEENLNTTNISLKNNELKNTEKTNKIFNDINDSKDRLIDVKPSSDMPINNSASLNNYDLLNSNNKSKSIEAVLREEDNLVFEPLNSVNNSTIINNLCEESGKVITLIQENSDNLQNLAYYTLLLKNTYLPQLETYRISEINDININELIDNTLNILSIKLKCDSIDNIFDFFNYISVGIQTSGQHLPHSEILEIFAQKISYGKVVDTYHSFINPIKTINALVQKSTGISNSDVFSAPTIENVLNELKIFANGYTFVGYNISFICSFINHYYSLYYNKELTNKSECLLKLYRTRYKTYHGEPPKKFDFRTICCDILPSTDIDEINTISSNAESFALAGYKLYEILKYRYK